MNQRVLAENKVCHHCGDPCDDEEIRLGESYFCCYGCKAVHELLNTGQLGQYFEETHQTNKSLSQIKAERKFAFLANEDIQKQLLRFHDEDLSVVRFFLPGIHCSSCIYLLEHLPRLNPAIIRSEVNFIKKEVLITFRHQEQGLKDIAVLLAQLGYPPNVSLDSLDKTKKRVSHSKLGVKIAVAGFCFGNAMLMSMPEYLDRNFLLTEDFKQLFGWINLVLALPLVLYSGQDYFIKAWKGLRFGNLNIDLPIALGIATLFFRSVFEITTQTGMGYVDSLAGLVFFLLVGKWYQGKTYQALSFERDYASYFPVSVTCQLDGDRFYRSLKELKKGDVVVIHNDELIPADGKVVAGNGHIDYSFVTGESEPVNKNKGHKVFAGGRQKGGELVIELSKSVESSELTSLWNMDTFKKEGGQLQNWVDRVAKYFTLIVIMTATLTGMYWWLSSPDITWNAVTAVLIVACPCALALVLPFAYGHAMRLLGRSGLYLKNAEVVELMARIDQIIFDKTGTLTSPGEKVTYHGQEPTKEHLRILKSALGNSAHPLSRQIHNSLPDCDKMPITSFAEETGKGFVAEVAGHTVKVGAAEFLDIESESAPNESQVHVFMDDYLGYFAIASSYRKGIFRMLERLKARFRLFLLSGDHSGEKVKLAPYFDELRFKQRPVDKLTFIQERNGHHLMVGDGLNDAGALKQATVGIAVAEDIHQFSPACDAIVSADGVMEIPKVLSFAQAVKNIVFTAFGLSFLYNIVGLSFAVSGNLTPLVSAILMPLSSVTVVAFVTLMVTWKYRQCFARPMDVTKGDSKILDA